MKKLFFTTAFTFIGFFALANDSVDLGEDGKCKVTTTTTQTIENPDGSSATVTVTTVEWVDC